MGPRRHTSNRECPVQVSGCANGIAFHAYASPGDGLLRLLVVGGTPHRTLGLGSNGPRGAKNQERKKKRRDNWSMSSKKVLKMGAPGAPGSVASQPTFALQAILLETVAVS